MSQCQCSSQKKTEECCGPVLDGTLKAPTAERLMRARFSAFTQANVDFILDSHHPSTKDQIDRQEVEDWSKNAVWKNLEVINTRNGAEGDSEGLVEFVAHYEWEGVPQRHHEVAQFKFDDGRWYFLDGKLVQQTLKRATPKVGRNDPCPCGSGKKFKKCCG